MDKKPRLSDMEFMIPAGPVPPKAPPKKAAPKNPDDIPPRNLQEAKDEMIRRKEDKAPTTKTEMGKGFKAGGKVGSASKRADGCAQRGKTRGRMV